MSATMPVVSALLMAAALVIAFALVGIYRTLPNPPPSAFSIRRRESLENSAVMQFFHPIILAFAQFNDIYPQETRADLELRIRRAGRPCDYTPEEYLAVCQTSALFAGVGSFLYGALIFGMGGIITGLVAFAIGYFAPLFVMNEWMNTRLTKLVMKLPYAIDLLALCMGSGSTFIGAVEELVSDYNEDEPLDQEFRTFLTELSLGKTRREALTNLADRCGIDLLNSLVIALIQGEEQGVSVSEVLKRQAAHVRAVRVSQADENAQKASTKILFPTMMIVVATLMILFGSFIVKLVRGKVLE